MVWPVTVVSGLTVCVFVCIFFFVFKQKTAYEMRISDWSSDVCSSDLLVPPGAVRFGKTVEEDQRRRVLRPHIDGVEFDSGCKNYPPLLEIARHHPLLPASRSRAKVARFSFAGKQEIGRAHV